MQSMDFSQIHTLHKQKNIVTINDAIQCSQACPREPTLIVEDGEIVGRQLGTGNGVDSKDSTDAERSDTSTCSSGEEELLAEKIKGTPLEPAIKGTPLEPAMPFTEESVLEWVLAPQKVDTFFSEVWERKPLHIEHQNGQYFESIMTFEDLEDVLLNTNEDDEFGEILLFKDQLQVYYDNAFRGYLAGASVVVNHVDKQFTPINRLCRALGSHFPHAFANMYLTPPNSQAVHPHSDDRDVLLLQVWGSKDWKVYGAPIILPYTDEQVGKEGRRLTAKEMGALSLDCCLAQGDVLYIPRGFVHEARAQAAGSLHLTVAIPTQDLTWAGVLLDALKVLVAGS